MKRLLVMVVVMTMAAGACTGSADETTTSTLAAPSTTPPTTTPTPATTTTTTTTSTLTPADELVIPEVLGEFALDTIWLDGVALTVAVADTAALRQQGLMFVEDMGDLDGMLFVFESDSSGAFWMKNTLIPLDIAFFDSAGRFVDGFEMEPCVIENCPTYGPDGSYRYALEMAAGDMPEDVSVLTFDE